MTATRTTATAAALSATLGLAAASWVVALHRMNGMDMGVATELGSFAFFVAAWALMMAAMMLPGAVPAVRSLIRIDVVCLRRHSLPGHTSPFGQWSASPSTRCTSRTAPSSPAR